MPKKYNGVKILKVRKNATLREIHRESKKQFTAADLARFCQDEPTVPAEQVLAELEAIYEKEMRRYKNSKNKKKRIQHGLVQKRSFLNHSEEGSIVAKRHNGVKVLNVRRNATLREIYRESKRQFTAEDLARFCQDEPMIPAEQFLAEMEAIHEKALRQRKKKKK
jgi:hypothetical protein